LLSSAGMSKKLSYRLFWMALPMCCLVACAEDAAPSSSGGASVSGKATGTTIATIEDTLPADGCKFVVHINDAEYAPDAATAAVLRARQLDHGMTVVEVEYELTGRTGSVACGFNTHRDLPEVALAFKDS